MRALFAALVARRLWVYGGGLAVVLGVRSSLAPSTARSLVVAGVLSAMVVTYAGEVWLDADAGSVGRLAVAGGVVGVAVGVFLALGGDLRGLLFLGGGLLFLNRGLGGTPTPDSATEDAPADGEGSGRTADETGETASADAPGGDRS
jgi:hypothetical protein